MGVLVAEKFEIVGGKIDDQQPSPGAQHARRLGDRAAAVVEEVQDLVDKHDIERISRQRKVIDVAMADAAMPQPGPVQAVAGKRQHVEGKVEAQAPLDVGTEEFEHAAGAGAEIEEGAHRGARQRRFDSRFNGFVGNMELADAVPLGCVAAKIGLGDGGAMGSHGGEALAVARHGGVGRV